jgi:hypothetical protein
MRMPVRSIAVIWLGLSLAHAAHGCSLGQGYELFRLSGVVYPAKRLAPAPEVSVASIKRGYNDGEPNSCSDAGVLVLRVPSDISGYRFELVEGTFDDAVFPEEFVRPILSGELSFVWLDGKTNWQEEIDVLVKVTAISSIGVLSKPTFLRIQHPGGARDR